jgi:Mg2+ and Co2+ transporter CorA
MRDRTSEFFRCVQTASRSVDAVPKAPRAVLSLSRQDFNRRASDIARSVHAVAERLALLTKRSLSKQHFSNVLVAQNKSIYEDPAEDIQNLTSCIKDEIERLQASLDELAGLQSGLLSENKQVLGFAIVLMP